MTAFAFAAGRARCLTATVYAEKSYYMAVVRYMNGRITSIRVSFCQHLYGRPVEWVLPCTASERVKVMFLDNLTDLRPLCEPGEYERAE